MTRGKVLLVGLAVLALGGVGYVAFDAAGFEGFSAGIAAQAVLVLIVMVWTGSYLFRVVTGRMTYMEQRRRLCSKPPAPPPTTCEGGIFCRKQCITEQLFGDVWQFGQCHVTV